MPAPKKTAAAPEKISPKKILRKQMEESIALALAPFITDVNSKKFKKHLKKAVRMLSEDMITPTKAAVPKKKIISKKKVAKIKAEAEA